MKTQNQTMLSENTLTSRPTDIIAGFPVRPGFFELNGATPLPTESTLPHIPVTVHPANFSFSFHPEKRNPCVLLLSQCLSYRGDADPWSLVNWTSKIWNTATALTALMNRKKAISSIKQKFFWTSRQAAAA